MDTTDPVTFVMLLTWLTLAALVGLYCGRTREKAREGLLLGLLLGPIGWLLILLAYPIPPPPAPGTPARRPRQYSFPKNATQATKDAAWEKARLGD